MRKASVRFAKATAYAYKLRDLGIKVHYRDRTVNGNVIQEFSIFDGPYIGRREVAKYLREKHSIEIGGKI